MDAEGVERVIAELRRGRAFSVPFTTTLWPDCHARRNIVRAVDEGFELATTFVEFWAGHGFSVEQIEREPRSEEELRRSLALSSPDEVERL